MYQNNQTTLHIREGNRFHDSRHSKSMVGKQHFSLQTLPMNPTYYYHAKDMHLHRKGHQQTVRPVLLGLTRSELKSGWSQMFDQDPLIKKRKEKRSKSSK